MLKALVGHRTQGFSEGKKMEGGERMELLPLP